MFFMGTSYLQGDGVARDPAKALEWYRKAAIGGYGDAAIEVGKAYWTSSLVARDLATAYAWFLIAERKNVTIAGSFRGSVEKLLSAEQRARGQRLADEWKPGRDLAP
jgi:uncharacterized protein